MDKRLEGSEEASAVVAGMAAACVGAGILPSAWGEEAVLVVRKRGRGEAKLTRKEGRWHTKRSREAVH